MTEKGGPKTFTNWLKNKLGVEYAETIINAPTYKKTKKKFILRFDGVWNLSSSNKITNLIESFISGIKNRKLRRALNDCDSIIFQSEFSLNESKKISGLFGNKPYTIITNPIAHNDDAISNNEEIKKCVNLISYHRHTPLKCSYLSIKVAVNFAQKNPKIHVKLWIIGSSVPQVESWLESELRKSIVPRNLEILREKKGKRKFDEICRLNSIVINLSHYDPCPNVVCETVSNKKPIIAINSGGVPELLGRNYKYLIEPFAANRSWLKRNDISQYVNDLIAKKIFDIINGWSDDEYKYAWERGSESKVAESYKAFILSRNFNI